MPGRKIFHHLGLLLIAFLLFSTVVSSQNHSIVPVNLHQWGAITLFHGLPSDHIRAISQTTDGKLWFGTDSGLVSYDGRRVEKIPFEDLATLPIHALQVDKLGTLWIGTDRGAFRFNINRFANQPLEQIAETQGKIISAISIGHDVTLTSEQGYIFTYSSETYPPDVHTISPQAQPLLTIASNQSALPLTSLCYTSETAMLAGSRGRGLLAIDGNEIKEVISHPRPFYIEAIARDSHDHVYFGARNLSGDGGLYRADDLLNPTKIKADTGTVTSIQSAANGYLWVGTAEHGVFLFKEGREIAHYTFENTAGGLRSNHIYIIFIDREGVIWFGTDRGICRYDQMAMRVASLSANAESNFVRALFQSSDGLIWCGTNRGLFIRSESNWYEVPFFTGKTIHSLNEDSQGRVYVGTSAGLYRGEKVSRPKAEEFLTGGRNFARLEAENPANDSIRALTRFQNQLYAASFGRGIVKVEDTSLNVIDADNRASLLQAVCLFADGNNRLLIGTANAGVYTFNGARITTDESLKELQDKTVWSITKTIDGTIWFATNQGLFALINNQLKAVLPEVDARCSIPVGGLQQEQAQLSNAVWCATESQGLFKIALADNGELLVAHYDNEQGLPSQKTFALLQAPTDDNQCELLIGTNSGIVQYEPGMISPAVTISRASGSRVYNEQEIKAGLELEYPQNSLLIDVAAISSRTFPKQFQYAFTLQDNSGKTLLQKISADSQLLMRDLHSGRYTLICHAFTGDLLPSEPVMLHFTVAHAPFPFASTALALLLLMALAAIWWGYRQNNKIKRTNATLAATNQQLAETRMQLANETETERRRIARDLHDQTLADLRRLMILTDRLPLPEATDLAVNPGTFRNEIESVSSEIRRICEDLSPSVLENVGLAAALEWAITNVVTHLPEDRKFTYEFHCAEHLEEQLHLAPVLQIHIYRIAQEVLNNISRHADATHVRVNASINENGYFILEIADNGCGFNLEKADKQGRGIANIRSRASLIDAHADWQPIGKSGTLFILTKSLVNKS
jgi:signal transduction histidine kinase/ligand-binding sensor domain-containing protein